MSLATELAERGLVPDPLLRAGIRRLLRKRLERLAEGGLGGRQERFRKLLEDTSRGPLAIATGAANEQHYEVPADFYGLCLGVHRKYSCCLYPKGRETLDEAENLMLELVVDFSSSARCRSACIRAFRTGRRPSLVNSVLWAS